MSLILDALNRSREEIDDVPTLETRHSYSEEPARKKYLLLGVALVAAIVVIAWLLWERTQTFSGQGLASAPAIISQVQQPKPAAAVEQKPSSSVTPTSTPVPRASVAAHEPKLAAPTSVMAPPQVDSSAVSALYGKKTAPQSSDSVSPQPSSASQMAVKPTAKTRTAATVEQDLDIGKLVKQAEGELKNTQLAEHPAPFINNLSQQTKDSIPSIFYKRHEYSGRPGQSLVVLNGKELKAGGSPASGVKIKEILPDSVVLDYRGTQFRLRALNSWVNL
ncbi:MAG: general secretion pathway protein GspB [Halioglobus sp.]